VAGGQPRSLPISVKSVRKLGKNISAASSVVSARADGMKTYGELLRRMTCATPSLAIEVYKRPEASGLTADDGNHERKSSIPARTKDSGLPPHRPHMGSGSLQRAR